MAITGVNNYNGYTNYDTSTANKQAAQKQKTFKSERAVQVDISKEAMDKYRAHIPVADHIIKAGAVFRSRFVL